ncbi:MAG: 4-diphosphocytidyl-2-C-methyl-D-erythritol kinase [Clostridia bacterium]|nr:4-diphosphocytidyl-2-C-methyl-D-erythritol kinase [Clostridia bacterium]
MNILTVPAYGKINLTLRVLGRRTDGFHDLSTIFQSIALHDTLILKKHYKGIHLQISGAPLEADSSNLVYQAAALLQQRYGFPGVSITLKKEIPVAAGLAGGSSDAAATLLGLNYFFNLGLTSGQLAQIGIELGSDVPFCVIGGTALGRSRGEKLSLLPSPQRLWLVLVKPPFGVSTKDVYKGWDESPNHEIISLNEEKQAIMALENKNRGQLLHSMGNCLEAVTCRIYPEVEDIKSRLLAEGAECAIMCGSGPTVYGVVPDKNTAYQIATRMKKIYPETFVSYTI